MAPLILRPQDIRILIGYEHTRSLADEFVNLGFNVLSCDLKKASSPGKHYQGNIWDIIPGNFHLFFGFPSCRYVAKAGLHHCKKDPCRIVKRDLSLDLFKKLLQLPIPYIALENPIGHLNTSFRQPNQLVHPWYFGDPYSKEICLWTKNLPPLMSPGTSPFRRNLSNHTNGRMTQQQKSEVRSSWKFYPNMCKEIARQYGRFILKDLNKGSVSKPDAFNLNHY